MVQVPSRLNRQKKVGGGLPKLPSSLRTFSTTSFSSMPASASGRGDADQSDTASINSDSTVDELSRHSIDSSDFALNTEGLVESGPNTQLILRKAEEYVQSLQNTVAQESKLLSQKVSESE